MIETSKPVVAAREVASPLYARISTQLCILLGTLTFAGCAFAQPASAPPDAGLTNTASTAYGVRINVEAPVGVFKNRDSTPDAYIDGNPHTRFLVTGAPYTIKVELPLKVLVEKLSLTQSDYGTEAAPKDLEITCDDGQKIAKTLELSRPQMVNRRQQIQWQDVPIEREVKSLQITVLSNYDGAVKWGGLGDLALWTRANLADKFRVTGYDAAAPAFVHPTAVGVAGAPLKVNLPPLAQAGEHPRLLFNPAELRAFAQQLPTTERGKSTLEGFLKIADGYVGQAPVFPSVEDTVANKADRQHAGLSNRVGALGFAYGLTGDQKYAKAAREILLGYAQRYDGYPRHAGRNKQDSSKVNFQRLSEAMWLIPQIEGYDYIDNSGVLSAEDKKLIETGLIRPAIFEIRRLVPADEVARRGAKAPNWRTVVPAPAVKGNYPNWVNFYSAATIMAGAVLDDHDMFDLAVADLKSAIATGIGADGMWGEGAIGYQLFAMSVISPAMETAARNGVDLWGFSEGRFKQLFDSPLLYAYPDGTLPGINDSGRGILGSWQTMVYDYGYLRYGDPRYAILVNQSPRQLHTSEGIYQPTRVYTPVAEPPAGAAGSTLFGSLGYSILRDGSKYALMDYGPHGGVHGHYDKLNLLLFANSPGAAGDEMGGEPKFHPYEDPLHGEWTTQTVAHNTMTVDGASQLATEGKLLVYEAAPEVQIMRAESAQSYAGVVLDRTVVVTPDAVLDLYSGRASLEHSWSRTLRFSGTLNGIPAPAAEAKSLGERDGFQHIKIASTQDASANWRGIWDTKAGKWSASLAGSAGQQVILGVGPDDDQMAFACQTGKSADFGAAYNLDGWGNPAADLKRLSQPGAEVQAMELTQKSGDTVRLFVAHSPGTWSLGEWKSDARVLVVRKKGAITQISLCGGTFAESGALTLHQHTAGNYRAQSTGAKLDIVSQWMP